MADLVQRRHGESSLAHIFRQHHGHPSHTTPLAFTLRYSRQLNLTLPVAGLAQNIADTVECLFPPDHHPEQILAAASIYIASYLLNRPVALADVACLADAFEENVELVYSRIYSVRYELVDEDWCRRVGCGSLEEGDKAVPFLRWPPLEREYVDEAEGVEVEEGM